MWAQLGGQDVKSAAPQTLTEERLVSFVLPQHPLTAHANPGPRYIASTGQLHLTTALIMSSSNWLRGGTRSQCLVGNFEGLEVLFVGLLLLVGVLQCFSFLLFFQLSVLQRTKGRPN